MTTYDIADDGIVICMGTPKKPDGRVANIRCFEPVASYSSPPFSSYAFVLDAAAIEHSYPRTLPSLMLSQMKAAAVSHDSSTACRVGRGPILCPTSTA